MWANRTTTASDSNNNSSYQTKRHLLSNRREKRIHTNPYWCLLSICSSFYWWLANIFFSFSFFVRCIWFGNICCQIFPLSHFSVFVSQLHRFGCFFFLGIALFWVLHKMFDFTIAIEMYYSIWHDCFRFFFHSTPFRIMTTWIIIVQVSWTIDKRFNIRVFSEAEILPIEMQCVDYTRWH